MNELVLNKSTARGVIYVIKAARKLTLEEMTDAINYRCSRPDPIGARAGDTVVMAYSPSPCPTGVSSITA
jgi:hypothetical protein